VQNASSSMRGAFFGPPMDVVHRDAKLNGPATGGYTTEEEAMSANLTDPAYHHVTPPYFYGPSSILLKYVAEEDVATMDSIWSATKKSSLYFEEYTTGLDDFDTETIGDEVPVSSLQFPTSSLSPKLPTKKSISRGSAARMKLEQSIDVWNEDGLIRVSHIDKEKDALAEQTKVWTIMPKWMCPVLDFGLPITVRRSLEKVQAGGFKQIGTEALSTTSYYNMLRIL
jgi:hypothetical protein